LAPSRAMSFTVLIRTTSQAAETRKLTEKLFIFIVLLVSWKWAGGYKTLCSDEVTGFLAEIQLEQYIPVFREQGFEKMLDIGTLTDEDLKNSMRMDVVGHRRRILAHVDSYRKWREEPSLYRVAVAYALYLVAAVVLAGAVALALLTVIVLYSDRVRGATVDLLTVAGLITWCQVRRLQRERTLPDLLCKVLHFFESLPNDAFPGHKLPALGPPAKGPLLSLPELAESARAPRRRAALAAAPAPPLRNQRSSNHRRQSAGGPL